MTTNPGLEGVARDHVDLPTEQVTELAFETNQVEQARAVVEVHEEIHVAQRSVITSGDAPEDPNVPRPSSSREVEDWLPSPAEELPRALRGA